jgi:hypothetical protein
MVARLTPEDRAAFIRCRRQWDLGARARRNLEPMVAVESLNVDRALRDALAVYYFPGMWDWSRAIVLPLVAKALEDALAAQTAGLGADRSPGFDDRAEAARSLLAAYVDWAPTVERLSPVLIEVDYEVDLPDPDHPEDGLFASSGEHIRYRGRADEVAVDEHDAYWIVRHRVVREWTPLDSLVRDEEAAAACWAWEQFYLGMEIAGTIHNEMRLPTAAERAGSPAARAGDAADLERGGLPQHDASGGGRSIPQHRRLYAQANEPLLPERVVHDTGPWFRRTWIRRTRPEVHQAGQQLATEAREMFAAGVAVYPSPSEAACRRCAFAAPCLALYEGRAAEAEAVLTSSYRAKAHADLVEGRLGGVSWSVGRGAAPPRFAGDEPGRDPT